MKKYVLVFAAILGATQNLFGDYLQLESKYIKIVEDDKVTLVDSQEAATNFDMRYLTSTPVSLAKGITEFLIFYNNKLLQNVSGVLSLTTGYLDDAWQNFTWTTNHNGKLSGYLQNGSIKLLRVPNTP